MAQFGGSIKHVAISKANTQVVIIAGVAGFLTVLCLITASSFISQNKYLSKVTAKKEAANAQLQANVAAVDKLTKSYNKFQSAKVNVIGGNADGEGQNDGPNSKIVLNALPSAYDFPALAASIEKILTDRQLKVESITGTDDELTQQSAQSSPNPEAVPMSFTFKIEQAGYEALQEAIGALNRSIRPMQVDSLTITSSDAGAELEVVGHTYYQPPKNLTIKTEVIKP